MARIILTFLITFIAIKLFNLTEPSSRGGIFSLIAFSMQKDIFSHKNKFKLMVLNKISNYLVIIRILIITPLVVLALLDKFFILWNGVYYLIAAFLVIYIFIVIQSRSSIES